MARKIGVLDWQQSPADTPRIYLKKNSALLLIRRNLAERISDHVIRRCQGKSIARGIDVQILALRPFRYGPPASFTDWSPRPSLGFLVMQLRTSRKETP